MRVSTCACVDRDTNRASELVCCEDPHQSVTCPPLALALALPPALKAHGICALKALGKCARALEAQGICEPALCVAALGVLARSPPHLHPHISCIPLHTPKHILIYARFKAVCMYVYIYTHSIQSEYTLRTRTKCMEKDLQEHVNRPNKLLVLSAYSFTWSYWVSYIPQHSWHGCYLGETVLSWQSRFSQMRCCSKHLVCCCCRCGPQMQRGTSWGGPPAHV